MDARVKVWKAIKMLKFPCAKAVRYCYACFALQTSRVHPWLDIRTLSVNQVFNKNAILIEKNNYVRLALFRLNIVHFGANHNTC